MSVKFEKSGSQLTIKLFGRLDTESSIMIGDEIEKNVTDDITSVIFDMENLNYLSSSGIRILVTVAKDMHLRNGKIDAINYSASIKKILDITDFFSICN